MNHMQELYEDLKRYLANASPEELQRDREFLMQYADVDSPTARDYTKWLKTTSASYNKTRNLEEEKTATEEKTFDLEITPSFAA